MPILYESYAASKRVEKLSPNSNTLRNYLIVFGLGAVAGGILVFGPTRSAVIHAVSKGAKVSAAKVEEWAAA